MSVLRRRCVRNHYVQARREKLPDIRRFLQVLVRFSFHKPPKCGSLSPRLQVLYAKPPLLTSAESVTDITPRRGEQHSNVPQEHLIIHALMYATDDV